MQGWRNNQRPIACLAVLFITVFCTVWSPAQAALVATNQVINQTKNDEARQKVILFMERADVSQQMVAMGVDPDLARSRVASMTDQEIAQISDRIDQLPAGRGVFESILIVAGLVAIVFFITDLIGWTDIYKVVNKQ
jgi:hypothetical protein